MKRIWLLTLLLLLLCSCSTDNVSPENNSSTYTSETTYEEIKNKYPDKTVLTWVFPMGSKDIDLDAVNNRLIDLGKDYVLSPSADLSSFELGSETSYTDMVSELIEQGKPVDIVYSWVYYAEADIGMNSYHRFIRKGIFEPISSYLEDTAIGKELYSLMPTGYWDSLRVGGSIYGLSGDLSMLSPTRYLFVNSELSAKYGYDVNKPFSEQTDVVRSIIEGENCVGLYVYDTSQVGAYIREHLVEDCLYFDSSAQEFKCITDNPDFRAALKSYFEMYRDGLLLTKSNLDEESLKKQPFAVEYQLEGSGKCLEDSMNVYVYDGNSYDMIPCLISEAKLQAAKTATGICSASKHKDEAFDLLATVHTDGYLCNLLCYGSAELGGEPVSSLNQENYMRFANKLICHPQNWMYVTVSPKTSRQAFEGQSIEPPFIFNPKSVAEEVKRLNIMMSYEFDGFLFSDSFSDFDEAMKAWREELNKAGLQTVIDEANRQYKEGSAG